MTDLASFDSSEDRPLTGRQGAMDRLRAELLDLAYQRLHDSLSAVTIKVLQHKGELLYARPQVDFTERRQAAETILRLADHFPQREDHEAGAGVTIVIHAEGGLGLPDYSVLLSGGATSTGDVAMMGNGSPRFRLLSERGDAETQAETSSTTEGLSN